MSQSNRLFKVLDEYIYFDDAVEAQEYAKNNPGKVIVRNHDVVEEDTKVSQEQIIVKKETKLDKSPNKIFNYLNQYVISQDEAKKEIALVMYYHNLKQEYSDSEEIATNGPVMLVGPTGSGKTFIVQKACEFIDTVFVHVDTSSMVPEGIVGYTIVDLAKTILRDAKYDMQRAEYSVVFFDEIDKLFIKDVGSSNYGEKVSNQLLRLLEGTKIRITDELTLDTSNMQFILGGAFQWLLDAKAEQKQLLDSSHIMHNTTSEITLKDLYNEGIPKEILGRMNTIINLGKLSEDDYLTILKNSKSSPLQELIKKVEFHGDKVLISDETLRQVAKLAAKSELGVRGIKQILKNMFKDALFCTAEGAYKTFRISYTEGGSLKQLIF